MEDALLPILLVVGVVALFLYSIGLQRKAVRAQRSGLGSVAESIELQRRAEATMAESIKLQKQALELEALILAELKKLNEKA